MTEQAPAARAEPTTDDGRRTTDVAVWADRLALCGLAVGVCLMLQPWLAAGFRWGFFVALGCTVAQIVTGHLVARGGRGR
jgi:hypothetical protein